MRIAGLISGLISVLLLGAVLAPPVAAAPDGKRVALLTTANTQPYMGAWTATFLKAAAPFGFKVTNQTTPFDAALQSQQIDDAIAQKFDVILVVTVNPQAIQPALTRAKAAGIPVILIVNPGAKGAEDLYVSFIGVDQTALGRLAGENVLAGLAAEGKKTGQVAAVTGTASQLNSSERMVGFKKVLAKAPDVKLVAEEDGKWNTAISETETSDLLVRFAGHGGLDAIFSMADNQASGTIQAIQSAGLPLGVAQKGIVVVASNCMKDGIIHIKDGSQFATNTQIPVEEANVAAQKLADFFDGKKLQKAEYVPSHSITRQNVDQYAAACSY